MKGADVVDNVSDRMWQNDVLAQTFKGVSYQLMGHDVPTEILNSNLNMTSRRKEEMIIFVHST